MSFFPSFLPSFVGLSFSFLMFVLFWAVACFVFGFEFCFSFALFRFS